MSVHAASRAWRSGSPWAAGGSCATSVRTCSGYLAAKASALTAPPLPLVADGDQRQRRFGGGLAGPDVVVQHGTRDVQGARRRLGHRECPSREVSSLILTRQAGEIHRAEDPATTARVGADVPSAPSGLAPMELPYSSPNDPPPAGARTGSPTSLPRSSGRERRRLRLAPHPAIAIMPPHRHCATYLQQPASTPCGQQSPPWSWFRSSTLIDKETPYPWLPPCRRSCLRRTSSRS